MKPLNRPMFRYGGPIKEGVMSGIREPKKDGGKTTAYCRHIWKAITKSRTKK